MLLAFVEACCGVGYVGVVVSVGGDVAGVGACCCWWWSCVAGCWLVLVGSWLLAFRCPFGVALVL